MSISLTLQEQDNQRIEHLKKGLGIRKKIDVIRAGLALLEAEAARIKRINRWKQAARLVSKNSALVNKECQTHSRIKVERI